MGAATAGHRDLGHTLSVGAIWLGPRRPLDRAFRAAYWFAFRVMRIWWFITRPNHRGALVAIWVGDRILVLRQSYRVHLNLPGGGVRDNETPEQAARRELREEVGLELPPDTLRAAWQGEALWDWRHDHVTIFEAHLNNLPDLAPDGREVVEARLIHPLAALAGPQAPFVERYLLQRLSVQAEAK